MATEFVDSEMAEGPDSNTPSIHEPKPIRDIMYADLPHHLKMTGPIHDSEMGGGPDFACYTLIDNELVRVVL